MDGQVKSDSGNVERLADGGRPLNDKSTVRSVVRAIDIVLALTDGSQSLGKVAEKIHLSKSTVHRLLTSLAHKQLVIQDSRTGEYMLGPGCIPLVDAMAGGVGGLGVAARTILQDLSAFTGETVTLHVRAGIQRLCIEEIPSPNPLRYTTGLGSTYPIYSGSAGKVLLAYLDSEVLNELLSKLTLKPITATTITDVHILRRELEIVRQRGYAESSGERVAGATGLSAPIFDSDGRILAALSILGPETRITASKCLEYIPEIQRAAESISALLKDQ